MFYAFRFEFYATTFRVEIIPSVILFIVAAFLLRLLLSGAPPFPSTPEAVEIMIKLLRPKRGERAVDLGSGDGRIVMKLARAGCEAHGYEINPIAVWLSRRKIRKAGLEARAFIHFKSFWGVDLSQFQIVTVFGAPHIMAHLETKLRRELRAASRVASYIYRFPEWSRQLEKRGVFIYKR